MKLSFQNETFGMYIYFTHLKNWIFNCIDWIRWKMIYFNLTTPILRRFHSIILFTFFIKLFVFVALLGWVTFEFVDGNAIEDDIPQPNSNDVSNFNRLYLFL